MGGANWLKFTTKMKFVLFGTAATVVVAAGNALSDSYDVASHPWVPIVLAAVPFILGYIPKEKDPNANLDG